MSWLTSLFLWKKGSGYTNGKKPCHMTLFCDTITLACLPCFLQACTKSVCSRRGRKYNSVQMNIKTSVLIFILYSCELHLSLSLNKIIEYGTVYEQCVSSNKTNPSVLSMNVCFCGTDGVM